MHAVSVTHWCLERLGLPTAQLAAVALRLELVARALEGRVDGLRVLLGELHEQPRRHRRDPQQRDVRCKVDVLDPSICVRSRASLEVYVDDPRGQRLIKSWSADIE